MGYLAAWKVLEEMITDFRNKGIAIPADIISNLRHAKTLINVLRVDSSHLETGQKVEGHLRSIESYLVSEGQKRFGTAYVEEWIKRLNEASMETIEEEKRETRFISGLPREQKWIRVKPSAELPTEGLKTLADKLKLSYDMQNDGCLLVYGKEEHIKDFVKKMTTKYGLKAGKQG
jgi:hypothetical protein